MSATAQPVCGFDAKMEELKSSNPEYAKQFKETEQYIQNFIARQAVNARKPKTLYTIPVVVHVMHTGGAIGSIYNPTDAQIMGAIDYLNEVYAGTYTGMQAPVEGGGVVDMELQFVLAKRTPSCGYTNGIERIDASSLPNYVSKGVNASNTDGCADVQLKDFARWNPAEYYNIWVVNKIDGKDGTSGQFTAGFAYFAGAPSRLDGTIMLATQMMTGQKTLPHEIGHAFNLAHVFQGSNISTACPTNTNCNTDGDGVCDTDPVSKNANSSGVINFSCRTGVNSCTGTNYTRNTESNFMGYTYCYTLFTNGQKARVQAAMSLPERASLFTSPGLTPCESPQINFYQSTVKVAETGSNVDGCRTYKDYTYMMTIGQAPDATATVTLAVSGTATRGLDYEITTNGNFTTPNNTLTFTAGNSAAQEYTLRVYDDAAVEPEETVILNFSVSTSGNAVKGTIVPTFTFSIKDNETEPLVTGARTASVGVITTFFNDPFNSANVKQRGQFLYTASELLAAGLRSGSINSMQLYIYTKASTGAFNGLTIKLGRGPADFLYNQIDEFGTDFTTVYTNAAFSTTTGWNLFTFATPYVWDGLSNIVVEYCYNSTTGTGKDGLGGFKGDGGSGQSNFILKSGNDCSTPFSNFSFFSNGYKPIISFGENVVGTEVETVVSGTNTEHLSMGSDDYFYSASNKLMARIKNLNAEPGCVQVTLESAGTVWENLLSGKRSAKVFSITPAANGGTTGYNLSLYFTPGELEGRDPSSLKIAKTNAPTLNDVNASNTVIVTPTVSSLGNNAVFTADFTGFSRFFLVDAMVALPLNLISFTGKLNDKSEAELHWEVTGQYNFNRFEVERSENGQVFRPVQSIPGKQSSGAPLAYNYSDKNLIDGINYYRLKMIDTDGRFAYSEVIKIVYDAPDKFITLAGNPVRDAIQIVVKNVDRNPLSAVLYNAAGAKIDSWQLGPRTGSLVLPIAQYHLAQGIYLLQVSDGNRIANLKVHKQ